MKNGTIIYLSHGGGPLPLLGDPGHEKMIRFMKELPGLIPVPDEILVISAHWEESRPTVIESKKPSLLYDYYGFPEESYNLKYPVDGNPVLAGEVKQLLETGGISAEMTQERGLDHGVFVPLLLMYPDAGIPVTGLSLIKGLSPADHIEMGKALKKLMEKNILIIGSGFSFHNMNAFFSNNRDDADSENDDFQDWLIDTCSGSYSFEQREKLLRQWQKAPHARYCHPREEHLLPLHVCFGLSGEKGDVIFDDLIMGKRAVALRW